MTEKNTPKPAQEKPTAEQVEVARRLAYAFG